jgi:hypothetical protein
VSTIHPSTKAPALNDHDARPIRRARPASYHSYLLRLWRDQAPNGWRASLQSTKTGERHSFADLDSLLAFLLTQAQAHEE